ncbi:arginase family protein [Eikenella sp. Marseille-P7795]|uniref:arginase family protein n=1 Tax=Eikenella sp. Marseille-P7795 TaxID=2866577 RepID=UPI001CE49701|nr:arginase family protein [Eikenella sp. Marseille-P7795]
MKTIRLLYPDHRAGGLDTYYFGANLMTHILPDNPKQPLFKVDIPAPDGQPRPLADGIAAKDDVFAGVRAAADILDAQRPDKIITIGGNCIVSLAPFDYLHGVYAARGESLGILWIDTHPDVSIPKDSYPNAHAMILGALLGQPENPLADLRRNPPFAANQVLYIGLQALHDYQARYLDSIGVDYKIQTETFVDNAEIQAFMARFDHVLVHLDIDVLDAKRFHSTYFANPELVGDGSGSGRMTLAELSDILQLISEYGDSVGFTVAEYLPFDEHRLHEMFQKVRILTE